MNLLVTLIVLAVFTTFAYRYLRESRIPELIEHYRPRGPIADLPESPHGDVRWYLDPSAAKGQAESRRSDGAEGPVYAEPQRRVN
ncbi:hypothetical protein [Nocardia brevicatena]|uniref:hypothetical protein n=1 Tax=Nocardia brevicatena TaxID=37327 RepID=UPI0005938729|nr:hypothetical protein [Nocardia brevicatena]